MVLTCTPACVLASAESKLATVTIHFSLPHCCEFGQQVCIVGNKNELGQWNISDALRLDWNEGNVWTGQVTVPSGSVWSNRTVECVCFGDMR